MLPFEDVAKLIEAGYSVADVLSLSSTSDNYPAPTPTPEPDTGPAVASAPAAPPVSDDNTALLEAIKDLTQMLRIGNINATELPAPISNEDRAQQVVANIIKPPRRKV